MNQCRFGKLVKELGIAKYLKTVKEDNNYSKLPYNFQKADSFFFIINIFIKESYLCVLCIFYLYINMSVKVHINIYVPIIELEYTYILGSLLWRHLQAIVFAWLARESIIAIYEAASIESFPFQSFRVPINISEARDKTEICLQKPLYGYRINPFAQ